MDNNTKKELQSAAFERLIQHLRERNDVQNIDLMNLAGFCRNFLSKWFLLFKIFILDSKKLEEKFCKFISFALCPVIKIFFPAVFSREEKKISRFTKLKISSILAVIMSCNKE